MKLIIDIPDDWKEIYDKGQDMKLAHFIGFKITEGTPLNEVLDKIRAEIDERKSTIDKAISEDELKIEGLKEAYTDCLEIIDKYREE